MTKGVSEVVATVVLLGITVTAAGSYMTISSDFQESINPDTEISDFDFNVESCWSESGKIHLLVRNQDDESANVTGVNIFSDEGPVSNVEYSKEIVGPSETFTTDFEASNKDLRLVSGETEVEYSCRNVDIEPAGPGTDPTTDPDPVSALKEAGGPDEGVIESVSADTINITDFNDNLCIGNGCENKKGQKTGLDTDIYVNESGDEMNGTLNIDNINSTDICIGSECGGPPSTTNGEAIGEDNKNAGSSFALAVPDIVSYSNDGICFGGNC
jgi:flagellin-like protein